MTETIEISWTDLKRRLMASLDDGKGWGQAMQPTLRAMHASPYAVDDWRGCSGAQVLDWMRSGFHAPELVASAETRVAIKPRPMWSEEDGDVDAGRLYGGYDDFYYEVGERDAKPGLTLRVDMFFSAMVKAQTIKDYGAFLAGLIGGLEAQGIDLQIELVLPVRELYDGAAKSARQDVRIAVKQLGELSDFTEWSACFSPASTRVLMFAGFGVASEKVGRKQTSFMSMSLDKRERGWNVSYDEAANVLEITADQRETRAFPAERMTAQLTDAGLI